MSKGPARIRVSLSRELTHSEREVFHKGPSTVSEGGKVEYLGDGKLVFREPVRRHPKAGLKVANLRLSERGKLYVESKHFNSRELYDLISTVIEDTFVNVFPTAVRTFRELG